MRILYVTTIGSTMNFFKSLVLDLIKDGNVVDIATNESESEVPDCYRKWGCKVFPITTSRSPFSLGNVKAIGQIKRIAKNYNIVHCHTPLAGMATRLACKKMRKKQNLKVMYTAHGFHFYEGAPKKNWLLYYPIEKICSRWTDVLITINNEDFELAKKRMLANQIKYVPGVGIDIEKYKDIRVDRTEKRKELDVSDKDFLLLSVGELNCNKNHKAIIKAIHELNNSNMCYMIAGEGPNKFELESLARQLNVRVFLLGYRTDVSELYKIADLFVHPSMREGLPVSVMEAIASKINVCCSNIRGCKDLVKNGLFEPDDLASIEEEINKFFNGYSNFKENYDNLLRFDICNVNCEVKKIYQEIYRSSSIKS